MNNPYVKKQCEFAKHPQHDHYHQFHIYEVDESIIVNVHDDNDRHKFQQWIFGIHERDTGKIFLQRIFDRTGQTLVSLVERHIPYGSIVITDSLSSYNALKKQLFSFHSESYKKGLSTYRLASQQ